MTISAQRPRGQVSNRHRVRYIFDIDPTDISEAKVELTMMDGVVRYRDGI